MKTKTYIQLDQKLQNLIDVSLFQNMLDNLNKLFPFPMAILDTEENILISSGWQDICSNFHRANAESRKTCACSDKYIYQHLKEAVPAVVYQCPFGMTNCAAPIIIDGKHLGTIFTSQFFLEKPNTDYFKKQAAKFNFDETGYLTALNKVPVWTKDQLDRYVSVLSSIVNLIVSIGAEKRKEIQASEAILENEERFKLFFDKAPDAIFLADAKTGIIVNANFAASLLLAKPVNDIIGKHQSELHPVRNKLFTQESFRKDSESRNEPGEKPVVENIVVRADGTEIPVEILSSTMDIKGKRLIQGIFRDVTKAKKSENNQHLLLKISLILGRTNDLNQALQKIITQVCQFDGIDSGGIYLVDSTSGEISLIAQYGLSEGFVNENSYFNSDSPNAAILNAERPVFRSYSEIQAVKNQFYLKEKIHSYSVIPIITDDRSIAVLNLASHQYDEIPDNTRLILESVASTIGNAIIRIKAENQLKESEEKYKQAFRTNPDSINITTIDGVYVDINEGFTAVTGYAKEDIVGFSSLEKNIWTIPDDRKKLVEGLKKDGQVENLESVFMAKDGRLITGLMSASVISFNNKPHILSITRDISHRKKMETELLEAKLKAEESDRLKTSFLANMSHELRTPMNGILGFSELLEDESLTSEERHEYVSVITDSGRSLMDVITNIVDISKLDSGQLNVRLRTFNLNKLLDELLRSLKDERIIKDKSHLKVELIKQLTDSESTIHSDEGKIRHIIGLLLNNAAKFTDEGIIRFGYTMTESFVQFFVKDTGKGISVHKRETIFGRFRQEEETLARKYGGVGLGLSIAKGLVQILNGRIWVESEIGKGSVFYIEIPLNTDKLLK